MLTLEAIQTARDTLLSASSWKDLESACGLLLSEANPTFSPSIFKDTISPILKHLLTPAQSPDVDQSFIVWSDRIRVFTILCKHISCGQHATNTFKQTIHAILPAFIKWASFILSLEVQNEQMHATTAELFEALSVICATIEVPVLASQYPEFATLLISAYFSRIKHYRGYYPLLDRPFMYWHALNGQIYTAVEKDSVLRRHFADAAPNAVSASITALKTAIATRPTRFSFVRDVLQGMESLASVDVLCYTLFEQDALYWCIHILWLAIRARRYDNSVPQDTLEGVAHASVSLLRTFFFTLGRDAIEEAASLRLFDALSKIGSLQTGSRKLFLIACETVHMLVPFLVYGGVLRPAMRSVRRNSFGWLGSLLGGGFTNFVRVTYDARCDYDRQARNICWGPKCPYFKYGGPGGGAETPQYAECSQCKHVAFCSVECQRDSWEDPRIQFRCRQDQILNDNHFIQDDNGNITVIGIPLRAKETGFFFFLATKGLEANVHAILLKFVTDDVSAYANTGVSIVVGLKTPYEIFFEKTSDTSLSGSQGPGDIPIEVLAPISGSGEFLKSTVYRGLLQLPSLMQLREKKSTETKFAFPEARVVRAQSRMLANPVGGWRIEL